MVVPLPLTLDLDGRVTVEPIWSLPILLAGEPLVEGAADLRVRIPEIAPDAAAPGRLGLRLEELLAEVVRPRSLSILLERNGRSAPVETLLLPPWSHVPGHRPWSLLTLVLPGEDEVTALAARVEEAADGRRGPGAATRALFDVLAGEAIFLEPPRMHHAPVSWQEVGPPWRVLGPTRPRRATCLDLVLLGAAVLESLGEAPLVLLDGDDTGHAWLGVADAAGWRPWTRETPADSLLAVEMTAVCPGETRGSWGDARRLGAERLIAGRPVEVLDVRAARPPQGRIRPLQVTVDTVAAHALTAARRAGDRRRAHRRESLHLLLGLLETRGPLVAGLLDEAAADRIREWIEAVLPDEGSPRPPEATSNWSLGLENARILARNRGSRVVQEGDLLRSVLQIPSRNIRSALEDAGVDPGDLRLRLETAWPRVREETHLRRPGEAP